MIFFRLFVEHLLPILLVAAAGFAFAWVTKIDPRPLGALAFNLLAPCLIFQSLFESHVPAEAMARIGLFAAAVMAVPAALAFLVARWRRWDRPRTSAVVLCALLPNVGNYGLSANLLAFGEDALAYATVFFVAASILANTVGVLIASAGRMGLRPALLGLVRVPAIWALLAAMTLRSFHVAPPAPVAKAISLAASACIPFLLVILGVQLRGAHLRGAAAPMLVASGSRLLMGIGAAVLLAPRFGLHGSARQAAIFESSMPTAVLASIFAAEYDVEPSLVASVVLLTTVLSPFTLTPLLAALR
jgi:predicted permease